MKFLLGSIFIEMEFDLSFSKNFIGRLFGDNICTQNKIWGVFSINLVLISISISRFILTSILILDPPGTLKKY